MSREFSKEKKVSEVEEFKKFCVEFDCLIGFLEDLSELIFYNGRIISFISHNNVFEFNPTLIKSSAKTLHSIKLCSSIGSFSDANILIRKLRDDLIQYVYILSIIKSRNPFTESSLNSANISNGGKIPDWLLNLRLNQVLTEDEKAVIAWFTNSVSDAPKSIKKRLEFENYMNVLKQNEEVNKVILLYNLQKYWEELRKKLNNYVHCNGAGYSTQNLVLSEDKNLGAYFKNINTRTSYILSFFLVLIVMIESSLISSTDYIDHLDCGLEPPENSPYLIAGFIQKFIDEKVTKLHPELKQFLIDNNSSGMIIE